VHFVGLFSLHQLIKYFGFPEVHFSLALFVTVTNKVVKNKNSEMVLNVRRGIPRVTVEYQMQGIRSVNEKKIIVQIVRAATCFGYVK